MFSSLDFSFTVEEIFCALAFALVITWILKSVSSIKGTFKSFSSQIVDKSKELKLIIEKCYIMFPKDKIYFGGKTFNRGMNIRIMTQQKKVFEGEFIGSNQNNMICILTKKCIVAHELENIEEITLL